MDEEKPELTNAERAAKIRNMIMGDVPENYTENTIVRILGDRGKMKNFESYIPPKVDREAKIRAMIKI